MQIDGTELNLGCGIPWKKRRGMRWRTFVGQLVRTHFFSIRGDIGTDERIYTLERDDVWRLTNCAKASIEEAELCADIVGNIGENRNPWIPYGRALYDLRQAYAKQKKER